MALRGVQPAIYGAVFFIDFKEYGKKPVVDCPVFRLRPIRPLEAYQPGDIQKIDSPKPNGGNKSRAPGIGLHGMRHLPDIPV